MTCKLVKELRKKITIINIKKKVPFNKRNLLAVFPLILSMPTAKAIHWSHWPTMKVLVTGASGFLGGRLCHALLRLGHSVRALVRRTSDLSSLPPPTTDGGALEIVYGDVTDYRSLLAAFSGCHVIFHAAALVEPWLPDPSRFLSVSSSLHKILWNLIWISFTLRLFWIFLCNQTGLWL